jgi:2-keto-4-pentenoate hydratase/2-oxohepta-3-ene-1,7-dioic acid hydratase in catechol pathway
MKIARFLIDGAAKSGLIEGERAVIEGEELPLEDLSFLPPSIPRKIVCVGLNYVDHAKELGMAIPEEPVIFLKPDSALNHHKGNIILPSDSESVDYEAELALVIKRKCKNVRAENAENFISGLMCFNDVTARDLQERDVQWTRAKGFDTFAPAGPWIVTLDEFDDLEDLHLDISLFNNGEKVQNSNTRNIIFSLPSLIEYISRIMTLEEGDIISSGSPPGVGKLREGDVLEVEIEKIGILKNFVKRDWGNNLNIKEVHLEG